MRIDPERVSQANESKDLGLIPRSLLRLIESRACSGVHTFDPYRLKSDDPLFKHYSFVELLYLDRFDEQTPRFVFISAKRNQGGPAVFRTKW